MAFNEEQENQESGLDRLFSKIPTNVEKEKNEEEEDDEDDEDEESKEDEKLEKEEFKEEDNKEDLDIDSKELSYGKIINSLVSEMNISFDEEIELEDSLEGLKTITEKLIEIKVEETKAKVLEDLGEKFPALPNLITHLESGASLETFQKTQELESFKNIELGDEDDFDEDVCEKLYRTYLDSKGIVDEEQDDLVENAKDTNKLYIKAESAKSNLIKQEEKYIEQQTINEKLKTKEFVESQIQIQKEIKTIIASENLLGFKINKEQSENLFNFISNSTKNGKTARDLAWENITTEKMLLLDYILLNDFKPLGLNPNEKKEFIRIKSRSSKENEKIKPDLNNNKIKIKSIKDFGINN